MEDQSGRRPVGRKTRLTEDQSARPLDSKTARLQAPKHQTPQPQNGEALNEVNL